MHVRKAKLTDVEPLLALINRYAEQGLMLPRSRNMVYESIREFSIVEEGGTIIGVASLHILWNDLAEIRALAVAETAQGQGVGKLLVKTLIEEALDLGCERVFALTYQPGFFERCGFRIAGKEEMPHKVWKECINCVKFPNCDEIAVIKSIK
ncbi:N-acetyltransferase [Paradesulfitobacterium ferrireducens]|uniref:N-acetyltransferase n=1 Tax=Paradesulfitobacterium ferrireducens TaxID=2816476 RepID=UPI001A8C6A33|nr:N-acetyltransferase [Paradesulfitobacterium ferrireducens]